MQLSASFLLVYVTNINFLLPSMSWISKGIIIVRIFLWVIFLPEIEKIV